MVTDETKTRAEYLAQTGRAMMAAARTAPKGCGIDNLEIAMVTGSDIARLSAKMRETGEASGRAFFLRDADNVDNSDAVVLIGVGANVRKLNCGLCGFTTCSRKQQEAPLAPCSFDVMDLGIAIGSAVSIAADRRVDNRIMYSAGTAARGLGMVEGCSTVIAIPLSCSGKSIYFDRKNPECAVKR